VDISNIIEQNVLV